MALSERAPTRVNASEASPPTFCSIPVPLFWSILTRPRAMAQDRVRAFVHGAQQLTRGPDHQAGIEARFPGHLTRRAQNFA